MYSHSSWHTSSSHGASATFHFNGNYFSSALFTLSYSVLQELEYGFLAQKGHNTGLTVSPLMAGLYPEMRDLNTRYFSNYSVVDLAFRTAHIKPCSLIQGRVLLLILTRLCSRHRPVLLSTFHILGMCNQSNSNLASSAAMAQTTMDDTNPAITYLPTQEDWVSANMQGWFNDTLQCVLHSWTSRSL